MQKRRQMPYLCGLRQIVTLVTPKNMTPVKKQKNQNFCEMFNKVFEIFVPYKENTKIRCNV